MDKITRFLGRLTAFFSFMVMLTACGGAPSDNPNVTAPSSNSGGGTDTEVEVNDGVINIEFVSASNEQVFLKGQGGVETSVITFKASDSNGDPLANVAVSFELNTTIGGVALLGETLGKRTGSGGLVAITLTSGTVPTPARITATVDGSGETAISDDITISTGVPVIDRFSLGINPDLFVDDAASRNNIEAELVVIASDQAGNPAFDGVRVSFWSPESGQVESNCILVGGQCTVIWRSAVSLLNNERQVSVLAYTRGAEPFEDLNANSLYDEGEVYYDFPEMYLDTDGSGSYTIGEPFIDEDGDQVWDSAGNGLYDGPCPSRAESCSGKDTVVAYASTLFLCYSQEDVDAGAENIFEIDGELYNGNPKCGTTPPAL
ncbi:hypothetical protein QFX18_07185 [Saccharophagus degradans]|uniref:hypothetical protein n=1 Tax=Saccharophagus degradans TaxID=86304 RepID=UPI0024780A05|nr:hypothetical protein [Saccharophagus degradans]WGO99842.1 hypothetical protein QFX18_07185 [Saccharophagus degradans]